MHKFLLFIFASSLAMAQTQLPAAPTPSATSAPPAAQSNTLPMAPQSSAEIPPNAPVITLHGFCPDKPAGTDPKSPDCQTAITRGEFEHLTNTLSPNMPTSAKQKLASDYSRMLVIANEARKRGLENTQRYNDLLGFLKMQLLAQELFRDLQEKAKPSEADIEKYYNDNASKYEELAVNRLFIPRSRPETTTAAKKAGTVAPKEPTDAELQAEGEKLRARLQAGETFEKLEKEVYEKAGFKTPPPPTTLPNWRRDSVPPNEQKLFDMKAKEISQVMVEPAGAYIYEVTERKKIPLADEKQQIESMLTNERLRTDMEELMANVRPEANQTYFRSMPQDKEMPQAGMPPMTSPSSTPAAAPAAKPGRTTSSTKPAVTKPANTTPKPQ